ncbi:hypothetical protein FKP32DRAFT_1603293 [Trametes sanguinea]|nr:hypothetical protein FKP32DRAFT_1603293 [Trametes sanguinea]
MESHPEERPAKRFKHQSYTATLREVHLPSALKQSKFDQELGDDDSHFHEALLHWQELNLAPAFLKFARDAEPLSASLPLLLHNWKDIVTLWIGALDKSDDEGLRALLDLFQKLAHDLRTTLAPEYPRILKRLLQLLPRSLSAEALTALLATFTALFNISHTNAHICQSVSQTLHTATSSLLAPLVRFHLTSEAPEDSFTLVRRVLTALIHHVKGPEQFAPVSEAIVSVYTEVLKEADEEKTCRILDVVSVVCSVRQGSRMTHKQLSALLSEYPALPLTDKLHPSLLRFATSALTAGEMALWTAHGRKVLERSWERPLLGIELTGALSDLSWGVWKLVAAPYVSSNTHKILESHPAQALELLAALNREKRLNDMDIVWKQRFQAWVEKTFSSWEHTERNVQMLEHVLELSSLLPGLAKLLVQIVNQTLKAENPRAEYESDYANSAWVIGACMQCISERPTSEWADAVDIAAWTTTVVEKWGWSSRALEGLTPLVRASRAKSPEIPLNTLYSPLKTSLLSHSRSLRLQTLRLLTSPLVDAPEGSAEVLRKALQAEEVSIDVQGVRERVLRINRLPVAVKDGDQQGAEICARWLIAQLKVNLRPLWAPAASALSALSSRFGDLVWELLFQELQDVATGAKGAHSDPGWVKEGIEEATDDVWEDERSWRDPSAHKMRVVLATWLDHLAAERAITKSQITGDRFDASMYETQLLAVLEQCSSIAEKHNRDLIPFFLSLAGPDASSKLPRYKLSGWLKLFSKFSNPNALRSTETMRTLYISLLSHPDRSMQRLALSCLLTYKSDALVSHEESLRMLLDETRWRDELTQLDFAQFDQDERHELVDVIIRLLYGMMLERKGRTRGADRRAAILSSLAGCTDEELPLLIDLMLQPIRKERPAQEGEFVICPVPEDVSEKQQVGFLTLLGDLLKHLGSRIVSKWPALLETLLDLIANAQASLGGQKDDRVDEGADEDAEPEEDDEQGAEAAGPSRTLRSIRQLGLKRFADFFRAPIFYDFSPYLSEAFRACISPRLPSLDLENTQSPSALLDLFYSWSQRQEYAEYLVRYDDRVLPKIYDCLAATNVKPAVISKVFDIVEQLQALSVADESILETVFKPHVSRLLANLTTLVSRSKGGTSAVNDMLGRRQISILSELAPYLSDGTQAKMLLDLFSPLLRKPHKTVPEKVKVDMTTILCSLFPLIQELSDSESQTFVKTYALLSQLFQTLRSRQARVALVKAFRRLADVQPSIASLAELMDSLNAYSTKRLEEPDFDRRLQAFTELNENLYKTFSCRDWLPVIYNMLSFIQDPVELTVRSNSATALKRFLDFVADQGEEYEETFLKVLYPGLKNGLRSKTELVRAEILSVFSHAVARCTNIASLQEMRVLLAGGDEEANFFNNIHHVQIHRRTRAIRRLAEFAEQGHLRSTTLAEIFIPLVGNYISSTDSVDHHLVNEAILATSHMAKHLNWGAYYALVQRYLKLAKQKDGSERVYVRAIVAILDSFHFPMDETVKEDEVTDMADADAEAGDESPEAAASEEVATGASSGSAPDAQPTGKPATEISKIARIQDAVNHRLLPSLISYLEKRDETEDSLRIPVATGIVQITKHLPQEQRDAQISKLLTVLSQVLRSKSQETRDLARETLCRIAVSLGPDYLPLMLREMRAALLRGPHLHILAYSVHSVLVHITTGDRAATFHTLDQCVTDVTAVASEVIFGESGRDVQSEGFKTKTREVRSSSSKGVDSFAILAKHITPQKISSLLLPIRNILQETETLKVMQQVEELLRRIASGLNSNAHLVPTELLVLCHTLISQNARFLKEIPKVESIGKGARRKDHALVQVKRRLPSDADHYANNSFRFVVFGLELFNTAFRRGRFDFKDSKVIARLESMVPVIGNTLYSSHMQVIVPGLKAAALIVRCPLKSIEKSMPVFIRQIIDIIKQAGSTEPDTVQTAFKSLATILREHPSAQVKEKDLVYLLELLAPDLEEPERQAAVFTMLRAIIARRFVVPEIYDIMDKVAEIMVTSQSPQVQELCRGALLQFLLDYPQGKGRLKNQMAFLVKNLSYVYESGRRSVMELLSAIIAKFETSLVQEYADLLFVGLVMVIANDDSTKCREMAAELIKSLLGRLETTQRNLIMSHVHSWAVQQSQPQLTRVSAQLYGLIVDFLKDDVTPYVPSILEDMNGVVYRSAMALESATALDDEGGGEDNVDALISQWQTPYHSLLVISKVLRDRADVVTEEDKVNWPSVVSLLLFPHAWVRTVACRLLGLLYAAVPVASPRAEETSLFSLRAMKEIAAKLSLQLKSDNLDEALGIQIVKNLFYIGKSFCTIDLPARDAAVEEASGDQSSSEAESGDEDEDNVSGAKDSHPLPWLFSKLSFQTRSALIRRRSKSTIPPNWAQQPAAILKWFAAMASFMGAGQLEHFLVHILSPVYRIIEDDTIRDPQIDELKTLAVELQDLLQSKVGTTKFAQVYNGIRQKVLAVRRERRTARVVQHTTNPAAAAKRKLQRNVAKKESRKRKSEVYMISPPSSSASLSTTMISSPTESFFSQGEGETGGIGLSDPEHASGRRRMLDVANELHLTGVQADIDLPVIAVIGQQSAGKSSLIESISGITLPRASGTCTRSPTECRLFHSTEPWKCEVSLRILTDDEGRPLGQARNERFGETIYDKSAVEDRIRRAQRAILNPSTDFNKFLEDDSASFGRELSFSTNAVCLQISGPDVEDLSFCDLPGLIASVGSAGDEGDIALVKQLVTSYVERPSCIILLTIACETDFQNQGAHQLARVYDPKGLRTIGVLTKPDRIPAGEEDSWLRYIRNQDEPLTHGWFCVKQPDSRAIAAGITWSEARQAEREFFQTVAPWNRLDLEHQNRLGTQKLVERLSDVLSEEVSQRLPAVQEELQELLTTTDELLNKLPKPPSSDALSEVLHLLSTFSKGLANFLEGTPNADGLLQSIRPACDAFQKAIRATEPDFRPYDSHAAQRDPDAHKYVVPAFLQNEEEPTSYHYHFEHVGVKDAAKDAITSRARTRELPHHYPFVVTEQYIDAFIAQWQKPTEALFREIQRVLTKHVKKFVSEHFAQYPLLLSRVHSIIAEFISDSSDYTTERLQWFLALERRPRTLNEFYYSFYREKFLGHYKACRPKADQPRTTFMQQLERHLDPDSETRKHVNRVLNGLTEIGLPGKTVTDLAQLLPPDPYDAALDIMAGVRAYFQVAYKRFSDNIPMTIDYELVLGLERGQALEKALRSGLGIGSHEAHDRCKAYIQEPRHVAERREELMKKRERLETARRKLTEIWL